MSDRIISKGPIRPLIESGVSDAPQASPKFQVKLEPGSPVKVWVSDTSEGRFVDADRLVSSEVGSKADPKESGEQDWADIAGRLHTLIPADVLARMERSRKNGS